MNLSRRNARSATFAFAFALVSLVIGQTTEMPQQQDGPITKSMIVGLSCGFGFFVALLILCCVAWNCCCNGLCKEQRDKIISSDFGNDNVGKQQVARVQSF